MYIQCGFVSPNTYIGNRLGIKTEKWKNVILKKAKRMQYTRALQKPVYTGR